MREERGVGKSEELVAGGGFRHVCMPVQNPMSKMMRFSVSFEKTKSLQKHNVSMTSARTIADRDCSSKLTPTKNADKQ